MDIGRILSTDDGPTKTAALAAWVQGMYDHERDIPVLVGGAAVELYTGGAYTTGDLDFVGSVTTVLERELRAAGFVRKGRHWIHDEAQVFIEFPGHALGPVEEARWLEVAGQRVRVVSLEDLLVDRLGAWQYWRSSIDGVNALLLWRHGEGRIHSERVEVLARVAGWGRALDALRTFAARWPHGEPPAEEVERWAQSGP